MTRILAIDTASEFASLCVLDSNGEIAEAAMHSPDGFAHLLFGQIEALLARAGVSISEIDCVAAGSGPGSFTGVRVALSAAKGLAESLGRPIVAVSNLRALAWHGSGPLRAPLLDARRGEVYAGRYLSRGCGSRLEPAGEETVTRFGTWIDSLPESGVEIISTDFAPFRAAFDACGRAGIEVVQAPRFQAAAIARVALADHLSGLSVDPAAVDANYVRRSDAEMNWKDSPRT